MKKVLFFALVVFCIVKVDDVKAMEGKLPFDVIALKKSLPDGLSGHKSTAQLALNNQINDFIKRPPHKDGSAMSVRLLR